jgi:hypothetical protein
MRETNLTHSIIKALQRQGGFWFKVHGHPGQLRGLPDIIGVYHGRFVGLEVKVPGREDRLTKLQEFVLTQIKEAGGIAAVITSVEEAKRAISGL